MATTPAASFAVGDRVQHVTTGNLATVLRVGTEPWSQGEVKIMADGAWVSIDTRAVFLAAVR